jgi:hypothetical protein
MAENSSAARAAKDVSETLALDADELRMLKIFHKSFNLPGLRYGLVNPVLSEDYYPEEEEEEAATVDEQPLQQRWTTSSTQPPEPKVVPDRRAAAAAAGRSSNSSSGIMRGRHNAQQRFVAPNYYEEPDASKELSALLTQTRGLRVEIDHVLDRTPTVEDDDEIAEDIGDDEQSVAAPTPLVSTALHSRQVRSRPSSGLRPGSAGMRPPGPWGQRRP